MLISLYFSNDLWTFCRCFKKISLYIGLKSVYEINEYFLIKSITRVLLIVLSPTINSPSLVHDNSGCCMIYCNRSFTLFCNALEKWVNISVSDNLSAMFLLFNSIFAGFDTIVSSCFFIESCECIYNVSWLFTWISSWLLIFEVNLL